MSAVGLPLGYSFTALEEYNYRIYQLVSMVIERCKYNWGMDGRNVYQRLKSCGAIDYIMSGYDCLHTQSLEYIIDDVESMLRITGMEGGSYGN